jgi:hypothetical protein
MKKKHQHFIPRTYLKKFAHTQNGDTFLVDTFNKLTKELKPNISVVDICVETDLYTLNHLEGDQKYEIENFFSDNIESKYPDIYRLLAEEKKEIITPEERTLILFTTLSMYFRTPKVLNQFVSFSAKLIDQVKSETEADTMDFLGYKILTKGKSFNEIKNEIKETNRIDYIKTQLALLNQFIQFKALDGLVVIELVGEQEFITSDNPVEIRNSFGIGFNLFDTKNSIYIPLDPKHALFIAPKLENSILNQVFYQRDNFFHHITLNHCVFENAERWILGTKMGIEKFLKDEEEYSMPADYNHPVLVKLNTKLELMLTFSMLSEKGISNENQELIEFLKKLPQHELYNESVEFQDIYKKLKEKGLNI